MNSSIKTIGANTEKTPASLIRVIDDSQFDVSSVDMSVIEPDLPNIALSVNIYVASPDSIKDTKTTILAFLHKFAAKKGLIVTETTFRLAFQALLLGLANHGTLPNATYVENVKIPFGTENVKTPFGTGNVVYHSVPFLSLVDCIQSTKRSFLRAHADLVWDLSQDLRLHFAWGLKNNVTIRGRATFEVADCSNRFLREHEREKVRRCRKEEDAFYFAQICSDDLLSSSE
jgi:hypothetical protein